MISPAKGNLFFRVLRKRSDGFHEIASLYTALSLVDTLSLSRAKRDAYNRPELDLVTKARDLFRKKTGICDPVAVHLEKRIPMGAGLGGGSSNAATMLYGMNQLLGSPVSEATLALWGAELGSDVPFFFSHGAAYCTGRGEIVRDAEWEEGCWIAKPKAMLKTPDVYRRCVPREGGRGNVCERLGDGRISIASRIKGIEVYSEEGF